MMWMQVALTSLIFLSLSIIHMVVMKDAVLYWGDYVAFAVFFISLVVGAASALLVIWL